MRRGRPIRIAWVDYADHRQYFESVIECLEESGCVVERVDWGSSVGRTLEHFQPDLVIIHGRPVGEIIEWTKWCHAQFQRVKVALLTAAWLPEYRADGFIPVPSTLEEYLKAVIGILDLKEEDYPLIWEGYREWCKLYYSED